MAIAYFYFIDKYLDDYPPPPIQTPPMVQNIMTKLRLSALFITSRDDPYTQNLRTRLLLTVTSYIFIIKFVVYLNRLIYMPIMTIFQMEVGEDRIEGNEENMVSRPIFLTKLHTNDISDVRNNIYIPFGIFENN